MCSAKVDGAENRVVTQVREIKYVHQGRYSDDAPKLSKGLETVKEEKLCQACVKSLGKDFVPQTVASVSKDVHETMPKKQKRRMMSRHHDIDYGDRPDRRERQE
jgi:hypothetical protein